MAKPALLLIGYGRMGREVEALAREWHFPIVGVASRSRPLQEPMLQRAEVVVDFSVPEAVLATARQVLAASKRMVIGTTGWAEQRQELLALVQRVDGGVVYSSNFSLGMQLFLRLVRYVARLARPFEDYDIWVHELHHRHKRDAPSGTALMLAEAILQELPRKQRMATDPRGPLLPEELHVSSSRGGEVVGVHTVTIGTTGETIELIHRATSRRAFAIGALLAAEWIAQRRGFYEFAEVVDELLQ
ncbi:MAG: 4-hydroxy-tetrahydrodipicolinate reductase [Candidatus Kapabacteria bacterium]|nr:4-hydroxy-tetrahydrodipicolinate reductase [Candidatus Kapabacteria bacterium]MCS7170272.1 4-hydroxy-tetrahydrodipicolinate reductase [Candidatus Kapabacteria bacterium]MDW7996625.1 4-hydroxy-tetrahydrodipicolinate reductase [Bacteroidota bacterium]MDW8225610.1 4-hydroxy-tetrahydrodipicolinate reductase [Bacteroidota bacterium]